MTRVRGVLLWLWRAVTWPLRTPLRLLTLGWLLGATMIGAVQLAAADDGFISTPATTDPLTVFERIATSAYTMPFGLSDANHGAPYVSETIWNIQLFVRDTISFLALSIVRGAISCMQWMLSLTGLYQQNAADVDTAVAKLSDHVFWPLIGATVAVAVAIVYAKARRDGPGSIIVDLVWVIVATTVAVTFATAPSKIMGVLDGARTAVADGVTSGFAGSAGAQSAAGFPPVPVPNTSAGAARALADSMWNSYALAPWCYSAFGSLTICADVGHDYLEHTPRWDTLWNQQQELNGEDPAQCPPEWAANCDWVRGQNPAALGGTLFSAFISGGLGVMTLGMVLAGVMAAVGLLLLILVGVLFVLCWMIPGRARSVGVRWFEAVVGVLLQSIVITALLGGVMVMAGLFNKMIPTAGLFFVAVLNAATIAVVFKVRAMFEHMTGLASPSGGGIAGSYMAARTLSKIGRTFTRTVSTTAGVAGGTAHALTAGVPGAAAEVAHRTAPHLRSAAAAVRAQFHTDPPAETVRPAVRVPDGSTRPALPAGVTRPTPYRPAGSATAAAAHWNPAPGPALPASNGAPPPRTQLQPSQAGMPLAIEPPRPPQFTRTAAAITGDGQQVYAFAGGTNAPPPGFAVDPDGGAHDRREPVPVGARPIRLLSPPIKPSPRAGGSFSYRTATGSLYATRRPAPLRPMVVDADPGGN
jgi:hypothetical protein